MKKGIIVNLKRFKALEYVNKNKILIVICFVFIIGIALGSSLFFDCNWLTKFINVIFNNAVKTHIKNPFFEKFFMCIVKYIVVLVLYFLWGASLFGVAVVPFISFWQGILIGNLTAHLYELHGLSGIAFNAIIVIPPLAIFIVCCFFAAKLSIEFSISIAKLTMPGFRAISLFNSFKVFCSKYLVYLSVGFVCTLFEIILNLLFIKFFNF